MHKNVVVKVPLLKEGLKAVKTLSAEGIKTKGGYTFTKQSIYKTLHNRTYRGEIHHEPWPLQRATAEITTCTMSAPIGISLSGPPPLLHFARRLEVVVWPLQKLRA